MKFMPKPDSKKLLIVAENRDEEAWLTTTKNKSVRPGDEKYVIRAYSAWRRQPHDSEDILRQKAADLASEMMEGVNNNDLHQLEEHNKRLENGQVIAEATRLWQKLFHETPRFVVSISGCFATMHGEYADVDGVGDNPKAAKAAAALNFLEQYA